MQVFGFFYVLSPIGCAEESSGTNGTRYSRTRTIRRHGVGRLESLNGPPRAPAAEPPPRIEESRGSDPLLSGLAHEGRKSGSTRSAFERLEQLEEGTRSTRAAFGRLTSRKVSALSMLVSSGQARRNFNKLLARIEGTPEFGNISKMALKSCPRTQTCMQLDATRRDCYFWVIHRTYDWGKWKYEKGPSGRSKFEELLERDLSIIFKNVPAIPGKAPFVPGKDRICFDSDMDSMAGHYSYSYRSMRVRLKLMMALQVHDARPMAYYMCIRAFYTQNMVDIYVQNVLDQLAKKPGVKNDEWHMNFN